MPAPARLLALLAIATPTAAWLGQIFRHRFLPRRNALEGVELRPRTIHIDPDWSIDVVEIATVKSRVERWMAEEDALAVDPFGAVCWPGAVAAARALKRLGVAAGADVLCVGAGTGLEALAASALGAATVTALDYAPEALELCRRSAAAAGCDNVEAVHYDLYGDADLPPCDVLVVADVLYDLGLAARCGEVAGAALRGGRRPVVVATDSQRYAGHGDAFLETLASPGAAWRAEAVAFTGSGLLVDDDQSYEATANVLVVDPRR